MENLREFIKSRKRNRIYRYSIRRLSIGVVSCVVGAFVLFAPVNFGKAELSGVVYAQKEAEGKNELPEKYKGTKVDFSGDTVSLYLDGFRSNTDQLKHIKDVNLIFLNDDGDKYELFSMSPVHGNMTIRSTKITSKYLNNEHKFKIKIKDTTLNQYNNILYLSTKDGILKKDKRTELIKTISPEEEKQERETLQEINALKEQVQKLVKEAATREEIVTKVAEEVTKEAEKIKEKLNKGEISGAATEVETVKNKAEQAANLAKEAKTSAEKAKQAAEELEKKLKK